MLPIASPLRIVSRTVLTGCARTLGQWAGRAPYHSYEHEQNPPFSSTEDAILSAAMTHVPTQGFSIKALARGARDAGYRDATVNLFPIGPFALVQYHLVTQRLALAKSSENRTQGAVDDNVKSLAWQRLQANRNIISWWQEVCAGPFPRFMALC